MFSWEKYYLQQMKKINVVLTYIYVVYIYSSSLAISVSLEGARAYMEGYRTGSILGLTTEQQPNI